MTDDAILKATGRNAADWYSLIDAEGLSRAPHKAIAEYLSSFPELSFWWAQSITVEYEKKIGRRVTGQTAAGSFQIGVSRTIPVSMEPLWRLLNSAEGLSLLLQDEQEIPGSEDGLEFLRYPEGSGPGGLTLETTTFKAGSHLRMRFALPEWQSHSILQIRLEFRSEEKTVLSFHQEKLPGPEDRDLMKSRWRAVSASIAAAVTAKS